MCFLSPALSRYSSVFFSILSKLFKDFMFELFNSVYLDKYLSSLALLFITFILSTFYFLKSLYICIVFVFCCMNSINYRLYTIEIISTSYLNAQIPAKVFHVFSYIKTSYIFFSSYTSER